jgi:hypothetical protein
MRTIIILISMMISAYAQPMNDKLKKDIENMDQIERTMRSAPPTRMGSKKR